MKRWIVIAVIGVLAVAGLVYMRTRPVEVRVVHPAIGTVSEVIAEDGKTRLDQEYIVTMPIDGRIRRVRLEVGDYVTSGDLLATIDEFDLEQQLAAMRSQIEMYRSQIEGVDKAKTKPEDIEAARLKIEEAKLQLAGANKTAEIARIAFTDAEREWRRMESLLKAGVVQKAQSDTARRAYDTAREQLANAKISISAAEKGAELARVNYDRVRKSVDDNEYQREAYQAQIRQIQAQMEQLKDQRSRVEIRSPVDGVVTEKFIEDEQVLRAGTQILKIGDLKSIEIESDILSEDVGRVKDGQPVEIAGKALGGRTIRGRVERVYPAGFKKISALGIEQQRVKVIVDFDNSEVGLRPYVSVDVRIIVDERKGVLTVPEQATFKSSDAWAVFKVRGGRLVRQPVEIGLRNDRLVEVKNGLSREDLIVVDPTNEMAEGMRVKPVVEK